MASLVEQIFMQAGAGSANGEGFGDAYAEGVKLGQQQQRINLEKQQLAAELAQMPLKQTLMQQRVQENEYNLTNMLRDRQNYVDSTKAFSELNATVSPLLQSGKLQEARQTIASAGLSNNFLLVDPRYKQLDKVVGDMESAVNQQEYRKTLGEASMIRAEAAQLRAQLSETQNELRQQRLELDKTKESRLQDQFDFQRQRYEATVPSQMLAQYRERAAAIRNDITLLASPAKVEEKLKALADELLGQQKKETLTAPSAVKRYNPATRKLE